MLDELLDAGDEVAGASEAATANRLLCDESEPAFNLVEPGSVGRREVDMEAGSLREPEAYLGVLVGGVIIHDQMGIEVCGYS